MTGVDIPSDAAGGTNVPEVITVLTVEVALHDTFDTMNMI